MYAEFEPAISIPAPWTLPINNEPVNILSLPSTTKAEPDIPTLFTNVIASAVLPFMS